MMMLLLQVRVGARTLDVHHVTVPHSPPHTASPENLVCVKKTAYFYVKGRIKLA